MAQFIIDYDDAETLNSGFEIITAHTAQEAVNIFREYSDESVTVVGVYKAVRNWR